MQGCPQKYWHELVQYPNNDIRLNIRRPGSDALKEIVHNHDNRC